MRLGCLRPAIWLRSDLGCGSLFQESLIGVDPVTAGVLTAGFAFAIKPILSPRAPQGTHPLVYVSSFRQSFS